MVYYKIPTKKYAYQSINSLYGISWLTVKKILGVLCLHPRVFYKPLEKQRTRTALNDFLNFLRIELKLRIIIMSRLVLLIITRAYRGIRLLQGLPSHGQRTHSNANTPRHLKLINKIFPFKIKKKTSLLKFEKKKRGSKVFQKTKTTKLKLTGKAKAKVKAKAKAKIKAQKAAKKKN